MGRETARRGSTDEHYAQVARAYADIYRGSPAFGVSVRYALSSAITHVEHGRALSIGYGKGAEELIFLAKEGFKVTGIDLADIASDAKATVEAAGMPVKGAGTEDGMIELLTGNFMTSQIPGRFDLVHMSFVLQNIPEVDKRACLMRMAELTAPGGVVALTYFTAMGTEADGVTPTSLIGLETKIRESFEQGLGWKIIEHSEEQEGRTLAGAPTMSRHIIAQKPHDEDKVLVRE